MTELATFEAPLTVTMKASDDRDAPWIVIRSRDTAHLESQLVELEHGSVLTSIGRVAASFNRMSGMGAILGATQQDPQPPSTTFTPPAAQPVTPAATQPPLVAVIEKVHEAKAAAGQAVASVPANTQPTAAQNAVDPNWGEPEGRIWNGAPAGYQPPVAAAPVAAPAPVSNEAPVGAPMTPFGPAKLIGSAPGAPRPWTAWADPRPEEQLTQFTREHFTDNPQDPGLQSGHKKFMQRIS